MRACFRRVATLCVGIAMLAGVHEAWAQGQSATAIHLPATGLTWEPFAPGAPVDVAPLWGDRTKPGEYGMFLRLKAGQETGMHAHTADYRGVNVQGIWVRTIQGDPVPKELPPGSYVFQPGKQFHNDMCKGPADCVLLVHQHAMADVLQPAAGR